MTNSISQLLDLAEVGEDVFESVPIGSGFFFGGYALGLMVTAAGRTVPPGQRLHSLHAYFHRGPAAERPLRLRVDRVRDGRAFTSRAVHAEQDGKGAVELMASYHAGESGPDWWEPRRSSVLPDPGDPDELPVAPNRLGWMDPLEVRALGRMKEGDVVARVHPYWARTRDALADDPLAHEAALAFVSDYMVVANAWPPGSSVPAGSRVVTVDHALWIHRPVRADDWLLFDVDPISVNDGRGLVRGSVRTRDGVLVASFNQEVLVRLPEGS